MKVSVVMTTYNGEKYILEQLISIMNQTANPDEVLIFDDCSNDTTPQIITKFIINNSLSNWRLSVNKNNLGWKKNFMEGFDKAIGDLIFPCDQDDIWAFDKIEKMTCSMTNNKDILLLASNYNAFYEGVNVRKISKKITNNMKVDGKVEKKAFDRFFISVLRPGCTYCFRKELLDFANSVWENDFPHDATLWRLASIMEGLYLYNEKLMDFRRYSASSSNPDRLNHRNNKKLLADSVYLYKNVIHNVLIPDLNQLYVLKVFTETLKIQNKEFKIDTIKTIIEFNKLRLKMFKTKKIGTWFCLQAKYGEYYYSSKTKIGDLYILLGIKIYKNSLEDI